MLDSHTEGLQAGKRFERGLFCASSSILMLGQAIELDKATIEDLVPREVYVDAVRECGFSFNLTQEETKAETNLAAMEKVFQRKAWGKFGVEQKAAASIRLIDK